LWSSKGCHKIIEESDLFTTVCECNHLTNFAALMDTSGREDNNIFKSISSYLCSGLSITGLILTIIMHLTPTKYAKRDLKAEKNRELKVIIICNLCICLTINDLLVIFGMDRTESEVRIEFQSLISNLIISHIFSFYVSFCQDFYYTL